MAQALRLSVHEPTALFDADAIARALGELAKSYAGRDRELRAAVAQHLKTVLIASRIEAEITYDPQCFRLRIRDNGKGIEGNVLEAGARQGHWGLPGIRERAKHIGARLKLWSQPGAGTEAELTVPARLAYQALHRRERFRLFR